MPRYPARNGYANGSTGSDSAAHADRSTQTMAKFPKSLPVATKNHVVATVAEFIGTFLFLLLALGATNAVNTAPEQGQPLDLSANAAKLLFISLAFGASLAVAVGIFYRVSGGIFNPAVTLALALVGAIGPLRAVFITLAQILGAVAAAAVVAGLLPGPLLVGTGLGGGTSVVQGLFIEMFLTAVLVLTILFLAVEKHRATFTAPLGIGLALFVSELMGVYYTGGSLNPARSFGPSVVTGSFDRYHWIYWIGPALGALLATGVYKLTKLLEYETVNPGQDSDGFSGLGQGHGGDVRLNPASASKGQAEVATRPAPDQGPHNGDDRYKTGPSLELGGERA